MTYDEQVKNTIRVRLFERWPPINDAEAQILLTNAKFFEGCAFDEADADGRTVEEIADDEIDAAADSQ